jgi:hypothetical protein
MPEISQAQAEALKALHWLLSEDPEHRASGRSMALAIAYLRLASQHPEGTWIRVQDHTALPPNSSRIGVRVVLRYIWDLASEVPAPVEIREDEGDFRLLRVDDEVRRYLYTQFVVTDTERGLTAEQLEEHRARNGRQFLPEEERDRIEWAILNPPMSAAATFSAVTQASATQQRDLLYWPQNPQQDQSRFQADQGAMMAGAMAQVAQGMQALQNPVEQALQGFQALGQQLGQNLFQGLQGPRETTDMVLHQYSTVSGYNPDQPETEEEVLPRIARREARQGLTIRQAVLAHVQAHPGLSATQIAHAIRQKPSSVSSTLVKEVTAGTIRRLPDGGPRRGWIYVPASPPEPRVLGPSVWARLKTNPFT